MLRIVSLKKLWHGNLVLHVITSYSIHYTKLYDAILPLEAAQALTGKETIEECTLALDKLTDAQVVITDGANGSYSVDNGELIHQTAYKVNVVDTTGCGDAFHAAYASALLQGMNSKQRMNYASFFAAQVAQHFGGRTFLPSREFMKEHLLTV